MTEFLTTPGVTASIERIIREAKKNLFLVSPYLRMSQPLFERLKEADRRKVTITIVYGKKELESDQEKLLSELYNLDLRFHPNLHAKCYYNEAFMVITSMNMFDYSAQHNREMGILISADEDSDVFRKADEEVKGILVNSRKYEQETLKRSNDASHKPASGTYGRGSTGFCIRCKESIANNKRTPLCPRCFDAWVEVGNLLNQEKYCHRCGKPSATSKQWPVCQPCALAESQR